jgi:predicted transcriptional regulator
MTMATLHLTLSNDVTERLVAAAKATSETPEQFAAAAIERNLAVWEAWDRAEKSLAPVRAAFAASGMTEDEAVELFEAEKHAWRAERRDANPS